MSDLRERLAALAHEQWSGWMRYQYYRQPLPGCMAWADEVRWERQMNTSYADLPEPEKESDRKEADRMLEIIGAEIERLRGFEPCKQRMWTNTMREANCDVHRRDHVTDCEGHEFVGGAFDPPKGE